MYRRYENPYKLEKYLCELEAEYQTLIESDIDIDIENLIELQIEIHELKDRVNFAWQDDEYDSDCYDYADEMWMYENCF